jgi:hypothetical protein
MRFVAEKVANQTDRKGGCWNQNLRDVQTHKTDTSTKSTLKFCQVLEELMVVEPLATVPSLGPLVLPSDNTCVRRVDGMISRRKS